MSTDTIVTTIDDLLFEDHWRYLDVAFLNHLWDNEWGLSELFSLPEETGENRKKHINRQHCKDTHLLPLSGSSIPGLVTENDSHLLG
jgi:hypothetical protein